MTAAGATVSTDAVRAYIVELRRRRAEKVRKAYSQEAVGNVAGMSKRSWGDYELGKTEGLRDTALLSVIRYLKGSFDDLRQLASEDASAELGRQLAEVRVAEEETLGYLRQTFTDAEAERVLADEEARAEATLDRVRQRRGLAPAPDDV